MIQSNQLTVLKGDAILLMEDFDALCVTTNLTVTKRGFAVMGRGIAKTIANEFPEVPFKLGQNLLKRYYGTHIIHKIPDSKLNTALIAFPVKDHEYVIDYNYIKANPDWQSKILDRYGANFNPGDTVPSWMQKANISLIEKSAKQLMSLIDKREFKNVLLPIPGIGNGELDRTLVLKTLEPILDDRVTLIYK